MGPKLFLNVDIADLHRGLDRTHALIGPDGRYAALVSGWMVKKDLGSLTGQVHSRYFVLTAHVRCTPAPRAAGATVI